MASPNVAGVAALVWSACPSCSVEQVEARLLDGDDIGSSQQVGKRVNAARAVSGAVPGPTVTPAPTSRVPTATPVPDKDTAVVDIINRERKVRGLAPLLTDPSLTAIARQHNNVMLQCAQARGWTGDCFSHQVKTMGEADVWVRLASAGYANYRGSENIGQGCQTVECMVDAWMNSEGHRANILNPQWTYIGAAFDNPDGFYMSAVWTTDFGRGDGSVRPTPTPTRPPANGLPSGWEMHIIINYDRSTLDFVNRLFQEYCRGAYSGLGLSCRWQRVTP
jgi:uncharacterized protein YkwD